MRARGDLGRPVTPPDSIRLSNRRDGPHRTAVGRRQQVVGGRPGNLSNHGTKPTPQPARRYGVVDDRRRYSSGSPPRSVRSTTSASPFPTWRPRSNSTPSVLGGTLAHRERNEEQGVEEAMIAFGDGAQVQLFAPLSAESTIAKFLDRNGPGLQQLAFRVPTSGAAAAAGQGGRRADAVRRAAPRHRRVVDQFSAPQGRRRGAGRTGPTGGTAEHGCAAAATNRRCVRGLGRGEWDDGRMSSNEWLPAQIPFDLVRRGFAPDQVTAHLERLEYDLRIATANGDATNQRLSEVPASCTPRSPRSTSCARSWTTSPANRCR